MEINCPECKGDGRRPDRPDKPSGIVEVAVEWEP